MCDTYSWWWCLNALWQTPQNWGPSCLWIKRCVLSALVVLNSFLRTRHLFTDTLVLFPEPTGVRHSTSSASGQTGVDGGGVEVFLLFVSNEKDIHSGLDMQENTKSTEIKLAIFLTWIRCGVWPLYDWVLQVWRWWYDVGRISGHMILGRWEQRQTRIWRVFHLH